MGRSALFLWKKGGEIKQMANESIRKIMRERQIRQYELGNKLKISDSRVCKLLRAELTSEWRTKFEAAIEEISEEKKRCLSGGSR